MQTFLPSTDFQQSAKWLDNARLGKQRIECLQILSALTNPDYGWQNHPAVNMWRGYNVALINYGLIVCREWISRGYKDTCAAKINSFVELLTMREYECYWLGDILNPPWLTEEFASNHRAILLGKAWEAYHQAFDDFYCGRVSERRLGRTLDTLFWYLNQGWAEKRVIRNENGKWPYLWPESL